MHSNIQKFRALIQSRIIVIRVKMMQREGESIGDALERTDTLYAQQEDLRAVLARLEGYRSLDCLRDFVVSALPDAKGLASQELTTAHQLLIEFKPDCQQASFDAFR